MTSAPVSITLQPFSENIIKLSVPNDIPTIEIIRKLPKRGAPAKNIGSSITGKKDGKHLLRHIYATHLLEHLLHIQVLIGHSSIKTTQIYTHVSREEIAKIRSPLASLKPPKNSGHPKEHYMP
jgi:integrase